MVSAGEWQLRYGVRSPLLPPAGALAMESCGFGKEGHGQANLEALLMPCLLGSGVRSSARSPGPEGEVQSVSRACVWWLCGGRTVWRWCGEGPVHIHGLLRRWTPGAGCGLRFALLGRVSKLYGAPKGSVPQQRLGDPDFNSTGQCGWLEYRSGIRRESQGGSVRPGVWEQVLALLWPQDEQPVGTHVAVLLGGLFVETC